MTVTFTVIMALTLTPFLIMPLIMMLTATQAERRPHRYANWQGRGDEPVREQAKHDPRDCWEGNWKGGYRESGRDVGYVQVLMHLYDHLGTVSHTNLCSQRVMLDGVRCVRP